MVIAESQADCLPICDRSKEPSRNTRQCFKCADNGPDHQLAKTDMDIFRAQRNARIKGMDSQQVKALYLI